MILIQHKEEIKKIKAEFNVFSNDVMVVAWTPSAVEGCIQEGIPFMTPADYETEKFFPESFFSDMQRLKEWCDAADSYFKAEIRDKGEGIPRPFFSSLGSIKVPYFLIQAEVKKINAVMKQVRPQVVYYFNYTVKYESIVSDVIGSCLKGKNVWGVVFKRIGERRDLDAFYSDRDFWRDPFLFPSRWNSLKYTFKQMLRRLKNNELDIFLNAFYERPLWRKKEITNILLVDVNERLRNLLKRLRKRRDLRFVVFDDVRLKKGRAYAHLSESIFLKLLQDKKTCGVMIFDGIDLSDMFLDLIKYVLGISLPYIEGAGAKFKELHEAFRFSLVIALHEATIFQPFFDQCEREDIPIFLFTHGICMGLSAQQFQTQFCLSGQHHRRDRKAYYLVYSQKNVEFCESLKRYFPDYTSHNVAIGSDNYEDLIQRNRDKLIDKTKKFLHIMYVYGPQGRINGLFNRGLYGCGARYQLRYRILNMLKDQGRVRLSFKFGYNIEDFGFDFEKQIMQRKWRNVDSVASSVNFRDCMDVADLLFIEAPGTILSEALTTKKAIIALFDERGYVQTSDAKTLLQDRITVVGSIEETEKCFKDVLMNGFDSQVFRKDSDDQRFIQSYGTCSGGKSIDLFESLFQKTLGK